MKRVKKVSVVDMAIKEILHEIRSRTWKPGDKLPTEKELMKDLGVSRNALREALKQLQFMGVITIQQGDGTFVNNLDYTSYFNRLSEFIELDGSGVFELVEARRAVEQTTSHLAAVRAAEDDLQTLWAILEKSKDALDDPEAFTQLDTEFHLAVAKASRNRVLFRLLESIRDILAEQQESIALIPGISRTSLQYHTEILQAIQEGEGERAATIMDEHIANVLGRLESQKEAPAIRGR